jgi:hypothetical protein
MSEGYTIDGSGDEAAGIVVRYDGERGFRFHSASKTYHTLDGHVFATPAAAQRAAREITRTRAQKRNLPLEGGSHEAGRPSASRKPPAGGWSAYRATAGSHRGSHGPAARLQGAPSRGRLKPDRLPTTK